MLHVEEEVDDRVQGAIQALNDSIDQVNLLEDAKQAAAEAAKRASFLVATELNEVSLPRLFAPSPRSPLILPSQVYREKREDHARLSPIEQATRNAREAGKRARADARRLVADTMLQVTLAPGRPQVVLTS